MLVVLPVFALGVWILALRARTRCLREAMLGGAVLWGVALVAITEVLSLFQSLTAFGLAAAWLVVVLVGVALASTTRGFFRNTSSLPHGSNDQVHAALLAPLGAVGLLLGGIAVVCPPNTWDSMTYHMARVAHWSQNSSLAPYPTHILRQLYLQPGAEFVLLHLQILSGGDHLAGLVQWASMLGVLIGTSLLAQDLGASRMGALCASIFAASLPIGILESTSTQNDYVVAFWLVCATVFGLRLIRAADPSRPWATGAALGGSVGLALLTKATAYLFVFPVLVWVVASVTRRSGWRGFSVLVVAGAIALALNAGFYARNLAVFGSPVGPLDEGAPSLHYVNAAFTPPLLVSNVVRNMGVNLNATPLAAINVRTQNLVRLVHTWLGVDIADPRTTWGEEVFKEQPAGVAFDENFASNPLHLALVLCAVVAVWPLRRRLSNNVAVYTLAVTAGFVLLSVVLRWQPWNTRLELPLFILAAPLVATVVDRGAPRLVVPLASILLIGTLPWVLYNQARPLVGPRSIQAVGRNEQYFTDRPSMRAGYFGAVGYLAEHGCSRVGVVSTGDGWEYPLWPLLKAVQPGVEIQHVDVRNVSASLVSAVDHPFQPCAVVALGSAADTVAIEVSGTPFKQSWGELDQAGVSEQVAVFAPGGP